MPFPHSLPFRFLPIILTPFPVAEKEPVQHAKLYHNERFFSRYSGRSDCSFIWSASYSDTPRILFSWPAFLHQHKARTDSLAAAGVGRFYWCRCYCIQRLLEWSRSLQMNRYFFTGIIHSYTSCGSVRNRSRIWNDFKFIAILWSVASRSINQCFPHSYAEPVDAVMRPDRKYHYYLLRPRVIW